MNTKLLYTCTGLALLAVLLNLLTLLLFIQSNNENHKVWDAQIQYDNNMASLLGSLEDK